LPHKVPKVTGWQFEVSEVSASVWEVVGHDSYGNSVRCVGDLQECVRQCEEEARRHPRGAAIKRMIF